MPDLSIHIRLTRENSEKVLRAMGPLGRSASDVVNTLIGAIDTASISEIVRVSFTLNDGTKVEKTYTAGQLYTEASVDR